MHSCWPAGGGAHLRVLGERLGGPGLQVAAAVAEERPTPGRTGWRARTRWSESALNGFLLDKYGLSAERVAERLAAYVPGIAAAPVSNAAGRSSTRSPTRRWDGARSGAASLHWVRAGLQERFAKTTLELLARVVR